MAKSVGCLLLLALVSATWATKDYSKFKEDWKHDHRFPTSPLFIRNYSPQFEDPTAEELFDNVNMLSEPAIQDLKDRHRYMKNPRIEEIVKGKIYQAEYYAMGWPVIFITPEDTLIVVDAPESAPSAEECMRDFRQIPEIGNKPVVALVYTMFHADHVWGAGPIVHDPNNVKPPTIIAHSRMMLESHFYETYKGIKTPRTNRMYGTFVPDPPFLHDALVYRLRMEGPWAVTDPPTDELVFAEADSVVTRTIDGLTMEFHSVPGYTSDQIILEVPEWNTVHGADVFYSAMPNLYTVRGEPGRDVMLWAAATRQAATLMSEVFLATHADAIIGKELIYETLTTYADGIQYLHDQTVKYLSRGYPADVISKIVTLPPGLIENPIFYQRYGIIRTSVMGICDYYVGWFSGEVEDLMPVDRFERARNMVRMVGSTRMKSEAAKAYNSHNYEWSLELATYLWDNDKSDAFALDLRTETLKRLAEQQISIASRNYYLAMVLEDWELEDNSVDSQSSFLLLHPDGAMKNLQFHIKSNIGEDTNMVMYLQLSDINLIYKMVLRNYILHYEEVSEAGSDGPELVIKDTCDINDTTDIFCWRLILAGVVPAEKIPEELVKNGKPEDVELFMSYFDLDNTD